MQKLAEICIRRPIFAAMIILALVVVGIDSYFKLGIDRFPSVDIPTIYVRVTLRGAAPEEVESTIAQPIEEVVNRIEGLEQLRSVSRQGQAFVILTFDLNRNIDVAAQDVRDRIQSVLRDLPPGTDPPIINKSDNDDRPVMTIAVSGERSQRELAEYAENRIKLELERSLGVGEVYVSGGPDRAINIWVDADRLVAYHMPITAVREALVRQNADLPGGNIDAGKRELS